MALRWYVVHAYSNFEHRVAEGLKDRIKMQGLQEKFGEILVPTEEVVEMRDGQKRKSERKFYPGYVLVQMEMDETTWHLVKEVPTVLGFIGGTPEKPAMPAARMTTPAASFSASSAVAFSCTWSVISHCVCLAGQEGIEPPTCGFGDRRSAN